MFINVGLEVYEIMTSQENKNFMWDKVSSSAELYLKMNPKANIVFDEIPDLTVSEPVEVEMQPPLVSEIFEPEFSVEQNITTMASPSLDVVTIGDETTYNIVEMLDKLYEHVSVTDPSLGKMLSKYEKFTLHTSSGELDVYPTTRIPEDNRNSITFKDLVMLLKYFSIMGAEQVTLKKRDGNSTE